MIPEPNRSQEPAQEDSPDLFDWSLLKDYAGFVWRAPLRHRTLSIASALLVLGATVAFLQVYPKRWQVEASILAQRNPLSLGADRDFDAPTRAAREIVLRRDNIVSLLKQTDFVNRHRASRTPLAEARAWFWNSLRGRPPTPEEMLEDMVDAVEERIWVIVSAETGTVNIGFGWSNRELAYDVVEAALQNFLEARHASEVSSIGETISILEEHAGRLNHEISAKTKEVEALEREVRASAGPRRAPVRARPPRDEELAKIDARLITRRRALADLEDYRQRRIAELQNQLVQQETMYAEQHPVLVATRRSIEALAQRSPQIEALRGEVSDLEREITRRGGRAADAGREAALPLPLDLSDPTLRRESEDPKLEYERHKLWLLVRQHSGLLDRIDGARVQMDTARAGFKYRYSVISPPQLPKAPISPRSARILAMGLVASVLFAFFASVAEDLRHGRVVERWQIERRLGLPVLAELRDS